LINTYLIDVDDDTEELGGTVLFPSGRPNKFDAATVDGFILLLVGIAVTVALTGKLNMKFCGGFVVLGVGAGVLDAWIDRFTRPNKLEFCASVGSGGVEVGTLPFEVMVDGLEM
jgi:hypothetical protein